MIGLALLPHLEAAAKERMRAGGKEAGRGRPQQDKPQTATPIVQARDMAARPFPAIGLVFLWLTSPQRYIDARIG
jgi:hypothetical protein